MPTYKYEAITTEGKVVSGSVEADSVSAAVEQLTQQRLTIQSVRAFTGVGSSDAAHSAGSNSPYPQESSNDAAEVPPALYLQRIDDALQQRDRLLPVLDAFAAEHASKTAGAELRHFIARLQAGVTAQQMLRDPDLVGWLPLLISGSSSASMTEHYSKLISHMTHEDAARRQRRMGLLYPAVLLVLTGCVLLVICIAVIPVFHSIFRDFGIRLPTITLVVLNIGNYVGASPVLFLLRLVITVMVVALLVRFWIRHAFTNRLFGAVVAGNANNVFAMSRFTNVLAELVNIGAPVPDALRVAGVACQHEYFRLMSSRLANDLQAQDETMRLSPVAHTLPACVLHALQASEDGGPSVSLLRQLSTVYSQRVLRRTSHLAGIGSPALLFAIGSIIALVVIALYAPLVTLITVLS